MWNNPLTYCALAGLGFGVWPFLARYSGLPPTWLAVMITVGTFSAASVWTAIAPKAGPITIRALAICLVAGLLNGLGMIFYAKLVGWQDSSVEVSKIMPLTTLLMIGFGVMIGAGLFHEPITMKKAAGLVLAAGAVMLLR
ncbi:MAG: hypothetical protein NTV81_01680 [Candidatus Komeilibacteria bacterium]|nr:hypothetical protein [Candidatus Komeilibacteria bacterium]